MSSAFPSLVNLNFLSDSTKEKAARELNESDETRQAKIDELRHKIQEYPDEEGCLVNSRRDDAFLLRFLRTKKFDTDRAFQQYKNYFDYRKKHPEIFDEFTFEKVEPFLRTGVFTIGNRTKEGAQIIYMDSSKMDFSKYCTDDSIRALAFSLDFLIESLETQVHGFVLVEDHANLRFRDIFAMGHKDAKKITGFVQDCFPARFKGIHMLHQPWYVTIFFAIMKPFMKQKLRERVHFHGYNHAEFHKFIEPENLPESMGGILPLTDPEVWIEYLKDKCQGTLIV